MYDPAASAGSTRCSSMVCWSQLVRLGEVHDGARGGRRNDDVVGYGLEARDEPLGDDRKHRQSKEHDEHVDGGPAEGEAVHLQDAPGDLLELLLGQILLPSLVDLLR
jgi:hypothetical protein